MTRGPEIPVPRAFAPRPASPRLLVLVGPRGAGKTTLGRLLAEWLALPFVDADDHLAAAAGMPAGEFLRRAGEAAFRALEERVTLPLLAGAGVAALGGGAVLSPVIRARLLEPGCRVALLLADPATLAARIRTAAVSRPALTDLPLDAEVTALLASRLPLYRQVAAREFDTGSVAVEAVVAALARWVADADGAR